MSKPIKNSGDEALSHLAAVRRILIAAAVALAATFDGYAAERYWSGDGSDSNWNTAGNWDTLPTSDDKVYFRDGNVVGRTATLNDSYTNTVLHVGKGSSAENPYIFEATDPSYGLTLTDDGWLGYYETGWLWLKSGTYTFKKSLFAGSDGNDGDKYPLWLKVGDGVSDVTLNVRGTYGPKFASSSVFVADKATLDFRGKDLEMLSSSSAFITNSTMMVNKIRVKGTSSMTVSGSTMTVGDDFNVADVSGANCTFKADSTTLELTHDGRVFNVGFRTDSTGTVVKDGGDWSCYYLRLGTGEHSTGTFTMNDGTLEVKTELTIATAASGAGSFTLNGGTVTAHAGISATGTGTFTFNGGTLKAKSSGTLIAYSAGLTVVVGTNGGTIDSNNKEISIAAAMTGMGAMKFKGGRTITLTGANDYTGGTTIELGTKIVTSNATAKAAVLGHGLVIDGRVVLASGEYDVLEADGLTAADTNNITLVNCAAGSTVGFDDDATPTKIVVTLAEPVGLNTATPILVFPGKTIDEIKEADFTSRFFGKSVDNEFAALDSAKGYNKKFYFSGGSLSSFVVEFQIVNNETKCVPVEFTNGVGGVYAKALGAYYMDIGTPIGTVFLEQDMSMSYGNKRAVTTSPSEPDYGVCDFICYAAAPTVEWTLDADKNWSDFSGYDALAADDYVRIKATGNYTLTMDVDVSVGKIEFMGASGSTMNVSAAHTVTAAGISGIGHIANSGTIVKTGNGTDYLPFANASTGVTIVSNGTLKVASVTTASGNPYNLIPDGVNQEVRVATGATFDLVGQIDLTVSVRLAEGANFENSGEVIGNSKMQTVQLILDGNATATFKKDFGILAPGYKATRLELGDNTLTLDGANMQFWLSNATIAGDGTIDVYRGYLTCVRDSTGSDCTLSIGAGGGLRITEGRVLSVKNFVNGGTIHYDSPGMLQVTGTLTPGNNVNKLTLASGATVKASATTKQTVTTEFSASGTITIDASEISESALKAGNILVLTVPYAYDTSSAAWVVSNPPIAGARAKWIGDGETSKTLYLANYHPGLMLLVR